MIASERRLSHVTAWPGIPDGQLCLAPPSVGDSARWMADNRDLILGTVATAGWVLVRGLKVYRASHFSACIAALGLPLADEYGELSRNGTDESAPGVFDVTPFPAPEAILFHHEGAHTPCPPRYLIFHCAVPAWSGGETPLADSARVLEQLPHAMREAFGQKGLLYKRNFFAGLDVPWSRYFGTSDPRKVEDLCAVQGIRAVWRLDGRLSTETLRPAVVRHPRGHRAVFFNQILLHHSACLDPEVRDAFQQVLHDGETAREVRFGDGSPIPDAWVNEILEAHVRVATAFRWEAGDIVVADNLAVAHARRPYVGERRHHVIVSRPEFNGV